MQVHQDSNGTVDSGHLCLTGYNEVVMIRRHPPRMAQDEGSCIVARRRWQRRGEERRGVRWIVWFASR
jgi:hypothetical protein